MNKEKQTKAADRRNTIAEIAAIAGVSIPTVSRVLNDRPDVAPETRERVEQILQDSGFMRTYAARAPRRGSSGIIDLVVPDLSSPYTVEVEIRLQSRPSD